MDPQIQYPKQDWKGGCLGIVIVLLGAVALVVGLNIASMRPNSYDSAKHDPALARVAVEDLLHRKLPAGVTLSHWWDGSYREPLVLFRLVINESEQSFVEEVIGKLEERTPGPEMVDRFGNVDIRFFIPMRREGHPLGDYPEWVHPLPTERYWDDEEPFELRLWIHAGGDASPGAGGMTMFVEYLNSSSGRPQSISDMQGI